MGPLRRVEVSFRGGRLVMAILGRAKSMRKVKSGCLKSLRKVSGLVWAWKEGVGA